MSKIVEISIVCNFAQALRKVAKVGVEMNEITIKVYAESIGVSHQAVYQMISNHSEEIEPYIIKKGKTRYLTEKAVELLDSYRKGNPLSVHTVEQSEQIRLLQKANADASAREKELLEVIAELRGQLQQKAEKEAANALLLAGSTQLQQKVNEIPELIQNAVEKKELEMKLQFSEREKEIEGQFEKTWFGLYRKK